MYGMDLAIHHGPVSPFSRDESFTTALKRYSTLCRKEIRRLLLRLY
jgi:hypothetical protein